MTESKDILKVGVIIGVAVAALVIGLIVGSFSDLEYYQYGFVRRKSTGSVDLSKVYSGGKHMVGPDYEFKPFVADAHIEKLANIAVFASDRLEIVITATYQYFLRKDDLPLLHQNYDLYYRPILRTSAVDALKGASTVYSTREFIRDRKRVEEGLFKAVRERLGGKCCGPQCEKYGTCFSSCIPYKQCPKENKGLFAEVRYFQLGKLKIPSDVENRYMKALLLQEENEKEKFNQEASVVVKETDAQVKAIENSAAEIANNATAQAQLLLAVANANSEAIVEKARSDGLNKLFTKTGLTATNYKSTFNYLRTLKDLPNAHLAVDFNQLIVGPMKAD